ncbi:MAG: hypothetical protein K2X93_28940 [Candidatus Obscuribacterales bacterium]|nr:hypothetical protein [Candidatus Obscuribacterales bacterium]
MKSLKIYVCAVTMLVAGATSAIAKDSSASTEEKSRPHYATTMMKAEKSSIQDSPPAKSGVLSKIISVPTTAAGVACGVMVGVPVAIARDTGRYTTKMRNSMIDGIGVEQHGDLIGNGFAFLTALPFGIGSGLVCGSAKGFKRGIEEGKQHPFSKESMSIKE